MVKHLAEIWRCHMAQIWLRSGSLSESFHVVMIIAMVIIVLTILQPNVSDF